ncbi:hypothetical protein LTR10_022965 [Elasticomyces elasticus]|uniref:Developmental regulatory protein wetA n=1 Tax=Exophiala sideris TaxID=1016849 RepID=A0ABR0J8K0_9EURO|nr:hypothetical protein LTR10_022965 [Elasticomyces elasticus]KAK5022154.1 hypothetical protein LTS07_010233 [Exophiala sideris]KAK5059067.1 hypothetical protein LTR69_006356 [Exophiala sideris]KAK5182900.1 hypothetical protein LTR44_004610 [Eurotiomycetes sp. CCFEE 6388]
MALTDSPDGMFRPADKAFNLLFGAATSESNTFDEFFNEDMFRIDGSDVENKDQTHQYEDFLGNGTYSEDHCIPQTMTASSNDHDLPAQPWRQGIWCLNQKQQHSDLRVEKTRRLETKRPAPIQTMDAVSHYAQPVASAAPSQVLTSPSRTKRFATSPNVASFDPTQYVYPPFSREATLSPSPMYAQLPISPRRGHGDTSTWQQDFQNFHLRLPYDPPLHSPSASRLHNYDGMSANSAIVVEKQGIAVPQHRPENAHEHEVYSPVIDPFLFEDQVPDHHESLDTYNQAHQDRRAGAHALLSRISPSTGSVPSSGSSHHSHDAISQTSNGSSSLQSQPLFSPVTLAAHPPLPALEPEETYPALAAPTPQRIPHPILQHPPSSALTGLGIQYSKLEQIGQAIFGEPQSYAQQMPVTVGMAVPYPPPMSAMPDPMTSYVPLPPPPSYIFTDNSPFTSPRRQRRSPSRSTSPPMSPTNVSPRRNPRRSPTRTVTNYTHSRRKSIHKSGPMKDLSIQEPLPSPRARSSSRPPRTPKAPKTPTGAVGFVNFTPADSAKLMNDVAPSGSSKTRARREMEAKEKRKKLGEAALKAVKVAGGDVAVFEKAIFA